MRWIDYLMRFDFDIRYIKGTLVKVVDALSRYYEHDYWANVPELHNYVNANIRLDLEYDDLPREKTLEIEGQVIENRVQKMNSAKIQAGICTLRECIQDRDKMVAQMATNEEEGSPKGEQEGEDPSVFESQVKGENLCELMSQTV